MTNNKLTMPDSDSSEAPEQQSRLRYPHVFYGVVGAISFSLVMIAILLILSHQGHATKQAPQSPEPINAMRETARGDELLLSERTKQAMEHYQRAYGASASPAAPITYRLGICYEQLGNLETARAFYKMSAEGGRTELTFASKLALARILQQQGLVNESILALSKLAVISALPAYSSSNVGQDINYVMALARSAAAIAELPQASLEESHLFTRSPTFSVSQLLALGPIEGNQLQAQRPIGDDRRFGIKTHGPIRKPATTLLSAGVENQSVSEVLELLAGATSWKIAASQAADEIVSAKRVDVYLQDKTAAELLTLILEPQRLFWAFIDDTLVLDQIENISSDVVRQRNRELANDLLLSGIAAAPSHFLAPDAYLALGNLANSEERPDRAKTFYRETIEKFPGSTAAQLARFNLAKTSFLANQPLQAIDEFYQVVDAKHDSDINAVSFLYLGRIHLQQGDVQKAKTQVSRSLALATQQDIAATASLTLAGIYLLNRDVGAAISANSVLMEQRESLHGEAFKQRAIFLSALTRFRAAMHPDDVRRRKKELVAASMKVDPSKFFAGFGYLLAGDALADVGITEEAVRMYQIGLSEPFSQTMREELLFRLALEYRKQNEFELAENTLLELSANGSSYWGPKAAIELADLMLQKRDFQACIRHCRGVLEQGYSEDDNVILLRHLGRAYEELGEYEQAGHCFAGFLPGVPRLAEAAR